MCTAAPPSPLPSRLSDPVYLATLLDAVRPRFARLDEIKRSIFNASVRLFAMKAGLEERNVLALEGMLRIPLEAQL